MVEAVYYTISCVIHDYIGLKFVTFHNFDSQQFATIRNNSQPTQPMARCSTI